MEDDRRKRTRLPAVVKDEKSERGKRESERGKKEKKYRRKKKMK